MAVLLRVFYVGSEFGLQVVVCCIVAILQGCFFWFVVLCCVLRCLLSGVLQGVFGFRVWFRVLVWAY